MQAPSQSPTYNVNSNVSTHCTKVSLQYPTQPSILEVVIYLRCIAHASQTDLREPIPRHAEKLYTAIRPAFEGNVSLLCVCSWGQYACVIFPYHVHGYMYNIVNKNCKRDIQI